MTENKTKQYTDNQYNRTPDHELGSGFVLQVAANGIVMDEMEILIKDEL